MREEMKRHMAEELKAEFEETQKILPDRKGDSVYTTTTYKCQLFLTIYCC